MVTTWEEILKLRRKYVGGQLEFRDGGFTYRGTIKSLKRKKNWISIELEWCARQFAGGWGVFGPQPFDVGFNCKEVQAQPEDTGEGMISWYVCCIGTYKMVPKGRLCTLLASNVSGLKLEKK